MARAIITFTDEDNAVSIKIDHEPALDPVQGPTPAQELAEHVLAEVAHRLSALEEERLREGGEL